MNKHMAPRDPKKDAAAQNAQEGVVTVADLSLLTGIAEAQLTKFAKSGLLEHYGEYHGKRFFNFQKIVNWAINPDFDDEVKFIVRKGMEREIRSSNCPYSIEMTPRKNNIASQTIISWKIPATT